MSGIRPVAIKFFVFSVVTAMLTVALFFVFGQYTTGSRVQYSALFTNVSRLKTGQTVRVAGIRVGTVRAVALRPDKTVAVTFDVAPDVLLAEGTRAVIRYLNLVDDRYLELQEGPGSTRALPAGSQIPIERTAPALDLDLLLGGLRPVTQGLDPKDVNALSAALIEAFQGEGGTLKSLLSKTASFTRTLSDNDQTVQELIDNLNTVVATVNREGGQFSDGIDRLQRLITGLSQDRDTIGTAIDSLDRGTASVADLLGRSRKPLGEMVSQLNRLTPLLDQDKNLVDASLQRLPHNYKKLLRVTSYGSWANAYMCGLEVRISDMQYRTVQVGIFHQTTGRCAEPEDVNE